MWWEMKKKKPANPLPHDYICAVCAEAKGGIPVGYPCTVHTAECPYCGKEETLWATRDFHWPAWGLKAVWD